MARERYEDEEDDYDPEPVYIGDAGKAAQGDDETDDDIPLFLDDDESKADGDKQWYVVHCYSGYENKVRHAIEQRIETMGMRDKIFDVIVPTEEEIVFDGTLFIPPVGTVNRRIEGELGRHALDTGNGILLHGTPHKESIGTAATHGCIRLDDDAILWLYEMVPVGARVYIY